MKPVRVVQAGIGGFGKFLLHALLNPPADLNIPFELVATIDPAPRDADQLVSQLKGRGVPIFPSIDDFLDSSQADLAILATPIHLHASQTCQFLKAGTHVLCEKPTAATLQDAVTMAQCSTQTGKFAAIAFQWSFSPSIQSIKKDLLAGRFGKPLLIKSLVFWPRGDSYYSRNGWVGKFRTQEGLPVNDGPVMNATAHFLHNSLYLLGPSWNQSADYLNLSSQTYRARSSIETYDSAIINLETQSGCQILHVCSHTTAQKIDPIIEIHCQDAIIRYGSFSPNASTTFGATFSNGTTHDYGDPENHRLDKLWQSIQAATQPHPALACPVECTFPHVSISQTICNPQTIQIVSPQETQTRLHNGETFLFSPELENQLLRRFNTTTC